MSQTTFFTGKGGVGKSSLSLAFAYHQSQTQRTLLVEMSQHPQWSRSYEPLKWTQNLSVVALNLNDCLKEYVYRRIRIRMFVDILLGNEKIRQFFETAPGVEAIIVLGKIFDLAQSEQYDSIVVDAPATGHGLGFFQIPRIAQKLFRMGPIFEQAREIENWLKSAEAEIVLVTLLEDLPVSETIEYDSNLVAEGLIPKTIIANRFPNAAPLDTPQDILDRLKKESDEGSGREAPFEERFVIHQVESVRSYLKRLQRETKSSARLLKCDDGSLPQNIVQHQDFRNAWTSLQQVGTIP